jgi:hypothetical protein
MKNITWQKVKLTKINGETPEFLVSTTNETCTFHCVRQLKHKLLYAGN